MVVQTPMTCMFGSCRACNTARQRTFPGRIPRSPLAPPRGCALSAACGPSTGVRSPRAAPCSALVSALARLHGRQAAVGSLLAAGRPACCSGSRGAASGAPPPPPGGQASIWGGCKGCRQKAQPTCSAGRTAAQCRLAPLRRRPPPEGLLEQPDYAVYEPERPAPPADPPAPAHRRSLRTDLYMPTDYMLRRLLSTPVRGRG